MTPHLHLLLPEGLWSVDGDWVVLPPPQDGEVEAVLHRLLRQGRALLALVKRLVALVPPRGLHLTCFHGVFAPNASLRAEVMLPSPPSPEPGETPAKPKRPRLDWATALQRTFGLDVWTVGPLPACCRP